jgi:hypothetical protein
LPLLHFLRQESTPFEDVSCKNPVRFENWSWWGLEKMPYLKIRTNITARYALSFVCYFRLYIYQQLKCHLIKANLNMFSLEACLPYMFTF